MWVIALISSCVGALIFLTSFFYKTAEQQAASAVIGVAFAVIPYCIIRSFLELIRKRKNKLINPQLQSLIEIRKCPECGENILNKAISCIFCGYKFNLDDIKRNEQEIPLVKNSKI
jgi:predicted Zn-ribbon and HTH transcriptional regulator